MRDYKLPYPLFQFYTNGRLNPDITDKSIFNALLDAELGYDESYVNSVFSYVCGFSAPESLSTPVKVDIMKSAFERKQSDQKWKDKEQANIDRIEGKMFRSLTSNMRVGGEFRFRSVGFLCGYIEDNSFNEFDAESTAHIATEIDKVIPKETLPNNCNSGGKIGDMMKKGMWGAYGSDYITLKFDYLNEEELKQAETYYKEVWTPSGNALKADSIRIETTETTAFRYDIELIWWWD